MVTGQRRSGRGKIKRRGWDNFISHRTRKDKTEVGRDAKRWVKGREGKGWDGRVKKDIEGLACIL